MVDRGEPVEQVVLAVQHGQVRAVDLVEAEDVVVDIPRANVELAVRGERDPIDTHLGPVRVDEPRDRRNVVDRAEHVGDVGEGDEARAVVQQREQISRLEQPGLAVELPGPDHDPAVGESSPRAHVCVVIGGGDHDLVAG